MRMDSLVRSPLSRIPDMIVQFLTIRRMNIRFIQKLRYIGSVLSWFFRSPRQRLPLPATPLKMDKYTYLTSIGREVGGVGSPPPFKNGQIYLPFKFREGLGARKAPPPPFKMDKYTYHSSLGRDWAREASSPLKMDKDTYHSSLGSCWGRGKPLPPGYTIIRSPSL